MSPKYKQTISSVPFKVVVVLLVAGIFFFVFYSVSFAPTNLPEKKPLKITAKTLSDQELSDIDAQAFFRLDQWNNDTAGTGSSNVIRLTLGLDLVMNAHIESMKMGYYNNGSNTGWDNDTTNYYWAGNNYASGIPATTLRWNSVFVEMGFDNIGTNASRQLNYIEIGTPNCVGQITGTLRTVTGLTAGGTGTNGGGVMLRQTASGTRVVNFAAGDPLSFVFASKYNYGNKSSLRGIFIKMPNYHTTDDLSRP